MKLQKLRGVADIYNENIILFNHIIYTAHILAKIYSFEKIETPIIENKKVFHRTLGEESDIMKKETYNFLDRDKNYITLRPEFTASTVRAVISNNMARVIPIRLFSHGALFRHERPQKCRLRQFHQINYEYIGSNNINVDVELVTFAQDILKKLKINNNLKLIVNTLGNSKSRNKYKIALKEYLSRYKSQLSTINQQRIDKNPLRVLDTKNNKEQIILNGAPILYDFINKKAKERFEAILSNLKDFNIKFKHLNTLVRGMDYYTDFVFEFTTNDLGSQGTILAGGRYNQLMENMGGREMPAAGFAGGIERIKELLLKKKKILKKSIYIYIIPIGALAEKCGIKIAQELRKIKVNSLIDYGITLKKRMQKANKLKVKYSIIFGNKELNDNIYILKNMITGYEKKFFLNELLEVLSQSFID